MTVTALMPLRTYDPEYLHKSLGSMLEQTSDDWRLLIVVHDRDDDLLALLEPYLRDPRIDMAFNEGRKLAGSFNTGMRHAQTEFVSILFGDDVWSPDAVAVLNAQIDAHPEVDFFHSSRRVIGDNDEPLSSVHRSRERVTLDDFVEYSPVKHLLCWRREMGLAVGGMDETLNSVGPDDRDFTWTMAENGAVFRAIPECLYVWRDHRRFFRLTTHLPLSVHMREIWRIMRKHRVGRVRTARTILAARKTYLRQCMYRSPVDRWLRTRAGLPRRPPFRETYE